MDTIDTSAYVSEFTKRTLQQFGWEPGDPLPINLGAVISEIRERTPATKIPGLLVEKALMAEADVTTIQNALLQAKQAVATMKQKQAEGILSDDPNIKQLAHVIKSASAEQASPEIIDDRKEPTPAPPATENATTPEPAPEPLPESAVLPPPEPPAVAEKPLIPPQCPRCLWDMRQSYETEATELDKEAFVAITLGGERFKKSYTLLKDKYTITFRGLLAEENTRIHHQLLLDQKDGDFLSDTEWFLRMFEYRLACSIASVVVTGQLQRPIPELSEVDEMELPNKTDDRNKNALVRLREYVLGDILKSELTRRLVSTQFRLFQRLCESLEAMALEPNFW